MSQLGDRCPRNSTIVSRLGRKHCDAVPQSTVGSNKRERRGCSDAPQVFAVGELACRPSDGKFSTIRQHCARAAADFP
jgi:hypothetical protein